MPYGLTGIGLTFFIAGDYTLRALTLQCRIIFVGDIAQLPPIGAGFVFKDIIETNKIPYTHLTQVFRQEKGNGVVSAAHAIFNNLPPTINDDFVFIESNNNINIINNNIINYYRSFVIDIIFFII